MSVGHPTDALFDLALQSQREEREEVSRHLRECAACRAELGSMREMLSSLALALPPVAPSSEARSRLMASLAPGGRFAAFVDAVARHLDIAVDKAVSLLELVDSPRAPWEPIPIPGVTGLDYIKPPTGPRLEGATVGMLRLWPGGRFPRHHHGGPERVLVLEGGFRDEQDGTEYHPGMVQLMDEGTAHSFVGLPGEPCICIGVVMGAMEVLD